MNTLYIAILACFTQLSLNFEYQYCVEYLVIYLYCVSMVVAIICSTEFVFQFVQYCGITHVLHAGS